MIINTFKLDQSNFENDCLTICFHASRKHLHSSKTWLQNVFPLVYCHRNYYRSLTKTPNVITLCMFWSIRNPTNVYLLKVNNINTRKRCEICSKLTKKHQSNVMNYNMLTIFAKHSIWLRSDVFIVNFQHISNLLLVFLLLNLNK